MRFILALLLSFASVTWAADLTGQRAPGFALPDSHGQIHDPQDYRGKYLIVEFMQSTCPHCATFAPILEEASTKYAGKLAVISIAVNPDRPASVAAFVQAHKITYPVVFDCGQVAYSYVRAASVQFPRIFILDPQGVIRSDVTYSVLSKEIFEGRGLFRELDRLMGTGARK